MDYDTGFTITFAVLLTVASPLTQGLPCGEADPIPHGNIKYFGAGRLAQYFCDTGYLPFGTPMVSCYRGQWRGNKPICVAPGCRRLIQPFHSIRTEQLNGAVLRYQCGEGFRMEGKAVLSCDGRSWSGTPPACLGTVTPALPSLPPYPPDNAIEDPGNETQGLPPESASFTDNTEERRRPIFVGASDKAPVFHSRLLKNMRAGGVLPLYKLPGSEDDEETTSDSDTTQYGQRQPQSQLQRRRQIASANPGIQIPNMNRPSSMSRRIPQSGYSPYLAQPRRPQYDPFPRYPYGGMMMPRVQSPYISYGQPIYPGSYITSRSSIRPIFLSRDDQENPSGPGGPGQTALGQNNEDHSRIETANDRHDAEGVRSSFGNEGGGESTVRRTGAEKEDRVVAETPVQLVPDDGDQSHGDNENRIVPGLVQVPVPAQGEKARPSERARSCPQPKKPHMGYFTTRPLPRDYEGDEYLYLIEYHCLPGLSLVGGYNISYCNTKGRWTGGVPKCEKVVNCESGFTKQTGRCIDIDECATDNGGCPDQCLNYPGNFRCRCNDGFEMAEDNCVDIDECSASREKMCNHFCDNTPGSFICTCRVGYIVMRDNRTCLDINECLLSAPCDHLCQNTFGSFRCACRPNFRLNPDDRTCSEVCQPGYILKEDPGTGRMICADEDECMEHGGLFNCGEICNNTIGSYFCSCTVGYKLNADGQTCSDLDECEESSPCEYACINTVGSYSCSCPEDQVASEHSLSCVGCEKNSYMEDGECVLCPEKTTTEGIGATSSDECICKPGYKGNPRLNIPCTDIDECQDDNYGCSHDCVNTEGSVFCDCPIGYTLGPDGRNCQDRDECSERTNPCKRSGMCRNTEGGYSCTCIRGFRAVVGNPRVCVDINECEVNNGGCQGRCHNLQAGYQCSCYTSWRLDRDGKSCIPLGGSCPPLKPLVNGRVLPEAACTNVDAAITGRTCFYFCNGGYKLVGINRRQCGQDGWSEEPPECVAKSQCPPLVVPTGVRVIPPSCSTTSSLPWKMCVFSCEDQANIMKGRRAARCLPNKGWEYHPPTCVPRASIATGASAIPRIQCPRDIDVDLAPGQSVAKVTIAKPATNMEITEQRNDGSSSRDIFPVGITRVKFTAFTNDRHRQAYCVMRVHVRDKEAPAIQQCPGSISIESAHEFPEISWQPPLFRDNVEVVKVEESRHPSGNITWGTYNVSYTASDVAGNMAECAFTINIRRPKASRKQGIRACGQPGGPTNGQASCNSWARGVYCVPTCNPGFAFERAPPTYVCDQEGVWTPGRVIPDCIDMRSARRHPERQQSAENLALRTLSTTSTATSIPQSASSDLDSPAEEFRSTIPEVQSHPTASGSSASTTTEVKSMAVEPKIKIMQKPTFYLLPTEEEDAIRSRKRPPLVRPNVNTFVRHGVSQPRLIKLVPESIECPRGQVPQVAEDGSEECVDCPQGHYRPRTATAVECVPCKPGFYQNRPGKAYCNVCPNYVQGPRASVMRGREELMGLKSVEECQRIAALLGR